MGIQSCTHRTHHHHATQKHTFFSPGATCGSCYAHTLSRHWPVSCLHLNVLSHHVRSRSVVQRWRWRHQQCAQPGQRHSTGRRAETRVQLSTVAVLGPQWCQSGRRAGLPKRCRFGKVFSNTGSSYYTSTPTTASTNEIRNVPNLRTGRTSNGSTSSTSNRNSSQSISRSSSNSGRVHDFRQQGRYGTRQDGYNEVLSKGANTTSRTHQGSSYNARKNHNAANNYNCNENYDYNKQVFGRVLTKQISSAATVRVLQQLVNENFQSLQPIHVAACVCKLPKLPDCQTHVTTPHQQATLTLQHTITSAEPNNTTTNSRNNGTTHEGPVASLLSQLYPLILSSLKAWKSRELSNSAWALGKISAHRWFREWDTLKLALLDAALNSIADANPLDVANFCVGLAHLNCDDQLHVWAALAARCKAVSSQFGHQALANVLWAFGTVQYRDAELCEALAKAALAICTDPAAGMNAKEEPLSVARTRGADSGDSSVKQAASMGDSTGEVVDGRISSGRLDDVEGSSDAQVVSSVMSEVRRPVRNSNGRWAAAPGKLPGSFTAQGFALVVWSLARLQYKDVALLDTIAKCLPARMGELELQHVAMVAWGYGSLRLQISELIEALVVRARTDLAGFSQQELSNIIWGAARLGVPASALAPLARPLCSTPLNPTSSFLLIQACAVSGMHLTALLQPAADSLYQGLMQCRPPHPHMTIQTCSMLAVSMAKLQFMHEALLKRCCDILLQCDQVHGEALVSQVWALANLEQYTCPEFELLATSAVGALPQLGPLPLSRLVVGLSEAILRAGRAVNALDWKASEAGTAWRGAGEGQNGVSSSAHRSQGSALLGVDQRHGSSSRYGGVDGGSHDGFFSADELTSFKYLDDEEGEEDSHSDEDMQTVTGQGRSQLAIPAPTDIDPQLPSRLYALLDTVVLHITPVLVSFPPRPLAHTLRGLALAGGLRHTRTRHAALAAVETQVKGNMAIEQIWVSCRALASAGLAAPPSLSRVLVTHLTTNAAHVPLSYIPTLMWSLATMGCRDGELMSALIARLLPAVPLMSPVPLALSAASLGRAQAFDAAEALFDPLAEAVISKVEEFKPHHLVMVVWAFASLWMPHKELFTAVAASVVPRIHQFAPTSLSMLTWAFSRVNMNETGLMWAVAEAVLPVLQQQAGIPVQKPLRHKSAQRSALQYTSASGRSMEAERVPRSSRKLFAAYSEGDGEKKTNSALVDSTFTSSLSGQLFADRVVVGEQPFTTEDSQQDRKANAGGEDTSQERTTFAIPYPTSEEKDDAFTMLDPTSIEKGKAVKAGNNIHAGGLTANVPGSRLGTSDDEFVAVDPTRMYLTRAAGEVDQLAPPAAVYVINPRAMSLLLWSLARSRVYHPAVCDAAAACAVLQISQFTSQGLALLLWAMGTLRHCHVGFMKAAARKAQQLLDQQLTGQACGQTHKVAHTMHTVQSENTEQRKNTVHTVQSENTERSKKTVHSEEDNAFMVVDGEFESERESSLTFKPTELSIVLWAFAELQVPAPGMFKAIARLIPPHLPSFQVEGLANVLWSFALMGERDLHVVQGVVDALQGHDDEEMTVNDCRKLLYADIMLRRSDGQAGGDSRQGTESAARDPPLPPPFVLPPALYDRCLEICRAERTPLITSSFQHSVYRVLSSLGIKAVLEFPSCTGLFCIDIAACVQGRWVAIEADGPIHFSKSSPHRELGTTVARNKCLEGLGWLVITIPLSDWAACGTPGARQAYLTARLLDAGVPLPANKHRPAGNVGLKSKVIDKTGKPGGGKSRQDSAG